MTSGGVILEENMRSDLIYLHVGCILDIPNRATTEYVVGYFSLEFNVDFWTSDIDMSS